ncbi:TonB-dependent receptor [Flammeovirgaceae bacterium SG7u.111]|nr:TonB-dependent receptor [Flammeovirgaceae bacterium SG7u.132]WPO37625.1 TonB-dependent receptor [Flammeovirgaceae bacterium SG7u.111]
MNFYLRILLTFIFIPQLVLSQSIQVVDEQSEEAIEGVIVSGENGSNFILTDKEGSINISQLKGEILTFRHLAYYTTQISRQELSAQQTIRLKPSAITLDEIVLSANRWEQNKKYIPNQIVNLEAEQIAHGNPATTADILSQSGQVFVQKSQQGGGSPMLRGFAANSVLIVIDGVRMNNAIYRSGNLHNIISLDPNLLENAEVVLGPGSVIYGSDALGGVMDFHSITPALARENEKTNISGGANFRYGTAANEKTGHVHLNLGSQKFASLSSISFSDFDDLQMGKERSSDNSEWGKRMEYVTTANGEDIIVRNDNINIQRFSRYSQANFTQKFLFKPKNNLDFLYAFHFSKTGDVPRYDRLIEYRNEKPRYAVWEYSPQEWSMHQARATYRPSRQFADQIRANLAFQQIKEGRNDRTFQDENRRERLEKVDVWSLNIDAEKVWKRETHQLFYGLEFTNNQVASSAQSINIDNGTVSPAATRYPDGGSSYKSAAIYTSYKWLFNEKSTFTAGLRYNLVKLNATFSDTTFYQFPFSEAKLSNGSFNGSLGWVFRPKETWQININLASGFRAPNVDDAGKVFDSEPGTIVVPNPGLKPERAYSGEVGIAKIFGGILKAEFNAFYTYLSDAMVRRPFSFNGQDSLLYDGTLSQVQALVNTGKAYTAGASVLVKGELGTNLSSLASLNYTTGRDLAEDLPLRHIPPVFGKWDVTYKRKKLRLSADVQFAARKWLSDMSPSEQSKTHIYTATGTPSWYTLNFRTSYKPKEFLTLQAGMENILDKHYRPYSSGISAAGRNIYIGIRAKW